MKQLRVGWALVLLLVGCGGAGTELDLRDAARITVSYVDGMTFSTSYTFVPAERVLLGKWSKNGPSQGYRSAEGDKRLSNEQAAHLQSLIEAIRIAEADSPGACWEDTASLRLQVKDAQGSEFRYPTDPEKESCNGAQLFADKADVQALLEACRALLPEPTL